MPRAARKQPRWRLSRLRGYAAYQDSYVAHGCRVVYSPYGLLLIVNDQNQRIFVSYAGRRHTYNGSFPTGEINPMDLATWADLGKSFMRAALKRWPELRRCARG